MARKTHRRGNDTPWLGRAFPFFIALTAILVNTNAVAGDSQVSKPWVSRVVPESRGEIVDLPDGHRVQVRYPKWDNTNFSIFPGYGYRDVTKYVPATTVQVPPSIRGDKERGLVVWKRSPCVNCHAISGADVAGDERWAGNLGPGLAAYGDRNKDIARTYQIIFDPRAIFPHTIMPPWGIAKIMSAEDILDLATYLNSIKSPQTDTPDPVHRPETRQVQNRYFGDNLDATRNPAVVYAESGEELWKMAGSTGKSCGGCHGTKPEDSMKGIAVRYPRYVKKYGRVVSIEDFLSAHAVESAGIDLPVGSGRNLGISMLVKMMSNGLPVNIDLKERNNMAAWDRGKQTFYKRVGQRNHACADCHSTENAQGRWLGGKYIGRATAGSGLSVSYPAWRTSFGEVWGLRKRFQWCMLPHGANNLAEDAEEYADLELYLTALENGKSMNVPGIKD